MNNSTLSILTAALLALVVTSGCQKKEGAKIATQVAARVNADEITVHQVNYALARTRQGAVEDKAEAKRRILERLIDLQLARQKAIESELDRSPNVLRAIETAKTEILARAYLSKLAESVPKAFNTKSYYLAHPELFAQRRIFTLEEIGFTTDVDIGDKLRALLPKTRSLKEIADWLQSQGVKFTEQNGVRAAEQIPLDILPKLQAMKPGAIQLIETSGGRLQVIRLVAFEAAPIDEATAGPRIQQFLFNQRVREAIAKEMERIRSEAKIEYLGEFANTTAATKPNAAKDVDVKAEDEAPAPTGSHRYSWEVEAQPGSGELIKGQPRK